MTQPTGRVTRRAGTMAGFGSAAGDFLTIPQYIWWLRKVLTTYPGMLHPPYQTYYWLFTGSTTVLGVEVNTVLAKLKRNNLKPFSQVFLSKGKSKGNNSNSLHYSLIAHVCHFTNDLFYVISPDTFQHACRIFHAINKFVFV